MNWKPIETAPDDGSSFLACCDGEYITVCRYDWLDEGEVIVCAWDMSRYGKATHWMPLPEPPDA